jgi:hypothetical protein
MKHELKIEYKDTKTFSNFIKSCYDNGVLVNKNAKIIFDKKSNFYNLCKGLSNHTIRLTNEELIDGSLRFSIQEEKDIIVLYPCSIIYEMDDNKYSFII